MRRDLRDVGAAGEKERQEFRATCAAAYILVWLLEERGDHPSMAADSESAAALIPLPPDSGSSRCYEFYFLPPRHAPDLGGHLRGHIGGPAGRKATSGVGFGGTLD